MGIIIEFHFSVSTTILTQIKNNPNVKHFEYGLGGGFVELNDDVTETQADNLVNGFKNLLIRKVIPPAPSPSPPPPP